MKTSHYLAVFVYCLPALINACGAEGPSLDPHLELIRPLLDKTWKGVFKTSTPQNPMADVMRWERALNGKAVRVLHSVNDGVYGGETLFRWDESKQAVTYHYFTTAGFMTVGTASFRDGKLITHEKVNGSANGVTEVRGVSELLADGVLRVKTEHLKDSVWQPGREVSYHEDPSAKIVFK